MPFSAYFRGLWDARAAKRAYNLPVYPVTHIFIHHGATFAPINLQDADGDGIPDNEESIWRGYQRFHMETRGWTDIAYNFGVGKSGAVLEGRGWRRQGGATGYPDDRRSLSICAIGNFEKSHVTDAMMDSIVAWIIHGIEQGHIVENPIILGHKDKPYGTSCPGRHLHAQIPRVRSEVADGRVSTEDTMDTALSALNTRINAAPDGTKSEAIRLWQVLLFQHGLLPFEDIDGVKGPQTRAAHMAFEETIQANKNPNQIIGDKTWALLVAGPQETVVHVEVPVEVSPDLTTLSNLVTAQVQVAEQVQDEVDRLIDDNG